jgi:type III pantothenate kinase
MVTNTPRDPVVLAVAVGNTRTRWATFRGREMEASGVAGNAASPAEITGLGDFDLAAVASVNPPASEPVERALARPGVEVLRLGRDLNPPLRHTLDDASTLGIDRAVNAFAAYGLVEAACVVIDAGTAITVDFVDGEGVFHGGAIAPGVSMMLRALHDHTAALPSVEFARQETSRDPFGRDTRHAMQLGVAAAARGLVRDLVERYAEHYGAYPRVIATGGDASALFDDDGLVERVIPDLQLIGIQRTVEAAERADEE